MRYLSALGCPACLFGISSAIYASEFTLYDPGEMPNISMNCDATRHVKSYLRQSDRFRLHLEVDFAEKTAVFTADDSQDKISMALTSIVPLSQQSAEYLAFTNGSSSGIVSRQDKYIVVIYSATGSDGEGSVTGQNCKFSFR